MKGFSKSLKADERGRAGCQRIPPCGYKFDGRDVRRPAVPSPGRRSQPTPTRSPRRGDDALASRARTSSSASSTPSAWIPTQPSSPFASRAPSASSAARAHTPFPRDPSSGRHVWRATRNSDASRDEAIFPRGVRRIRTLAARGAADKIVCGAASSHSTPFHQTARPLACRYTETLRRAVESDGRLDKRGGGEGRPSSPTTGYRFGQIQTGSEPATDERSLRGVRARADPGLEGYCEET